MRIPNGTFYATPHAINISDLLIRLLMFTKEKRKKNARDVPSC